MGGFLIEIDGHPIDVAASLDAGKARARALAKNGESIKITGINAPAPSDAWYWDYEINSWVYSSNAALAEPKARQVTQNDVTHHDRNPTMANVKVYAFRCYDVVNDRMVMAKRVATLDLIKRVSGAPMMAQCYDVDESQIDPDGFYTGQIVGGRPTP
jgi:hypothetical protein